MMDHLDRSVDWKWEGVLFTPLPRGFHFAFMIKGESLDHDWNAVRGGFSNYRRSIRMFFTGRDILVQIRMSIDVIVVRVLDKKRMKTKGCTLDVKFDGKRRLILTRKWRIAH